MDSAPNSTIRFQPLKGINGRTDTQTDISGDNALISFNPSKESTAVLTGGKNLVIQPHSEFQPLKGINGRTDRTD